MAATPGKKKPLYRQLWVQVLIGMGVGVVLGHVAPEAGAAMKPLGDAFIKLIKMIIAPIIFVTVVAGLSKMSNMKEVGRIGVRAVILFEVVSTLAMVVGLIVGIVFRPGAGLNADPASLDAGAVTARTGGSAPPGSVEFFMNIIPETVIGAFSTGYILQVLFFSVLFGLALLRMGEKGRPLLNLIDTLSKSLFSALALIMNLAPIGTFGAMAFSIGRYGIEALVPMAKVVGAVYITCILFIFLLFAPLARIIGFRVTKYLAYIKEEILIVLATSTSEVALPRLMTKLEQAGCKGSVVGLVVPTGYSFNQDGSAIYQMISVMFIAQAMNIDLSWGVIMTFFMVLLLTSKGAAGVSGSAFVVLAATLASTGTLPVAGMALLLGIERFMSMARGTTNMICNGLVTIVVAWWDKALDLEQLHKAFDGKGLPEPAAAAE
ncbi:MAG: C4-dicarboxylate transporter DctA [Acidobacteriota bacterium]